MDFYDVINKRRTVREFLDKEVDFAIIKKILDAGNKAPTWNHNRNWNYIILKTKEEKEFAFTYAKKIANKNLLSSSLKKLILLRASLFLKMEPYTQKLQNYLLLNSSSPKIMP